MLLVLCSPVILRVNAGQCARVCVCVWYVCLGSSAEFEALYVSTMPIPASGHHACDFLFCLDGQGDISKCGNAETGMYVGYRLDEAYCTYILLYIHTYIRGRKNVVREPAADPVRFRFAMMGCTPSSRGCMPASIFGEVGNEMKARHNEPAIP